MTGRPWDCPVSRKVRWAPRIALAMSCHSYCNPCLARLSHSVVRRSLHLRGLNQRHGVAVVAGRVSGPGYLRFPLSPRPKGPLAGGRLLSPWRSCLPAGAAISDTRCRNRCRKAGRCRPLLSIADKTDGEIDLRAVVATRDGCATKAPLVNSCQPEALAVAKRATRFEPATFTLATRSYVVLSICE